MADNPEHPDLPTEVRTMLTHLNQLSGNIGTSARLDWTEQTLALVGQLGRNPDAHDTEDSDVMLSLLDDQIHTLVIDEYDLPVITRRVGDGAFRYELDVSQYIDTRPYILAIPFDDDLHGEPPEHYTEYLDRKDNQS